MSLRHQRGGGAGGEPGWRCLLPGGLWGQEQGGPEAPAAGLGPDERPNPINTPNPLPPLPPRRPPQPSAIGAEMERGRREAAGGRAGPGQAKNNALGGRDPSWGGTGGRLRAEGSPGRPRAEAAGSRGRALRGARLGSGRG